MNLEKDPNRERKTVLGIDARIFDFVGASILISILTLWAGIYVTNYEYVDQRRDEMVELYKSIPSPVQVKKDDYYFSRRLVTSNLNGIRIYKADSDANMNYYKSYLIKNRWNDIRLRESIVEGKKQYSISANKNEMFLEIAHFDETEKWAYFVYKKDWIYKMGF